MYNEQAEIDLSHLAPRWYNSPMSESNRDKKENDLSAKYSAKVFYEEMKISGFLHVRMKRIRNLFKAWRAEQAIQAEQDSSDGTDTNC